MSSNTAQYATVFSTALATIGLQFEDADLIRIAYLDEPVQPRAATGRSARDAKNKIEKFIDPHAAVKEIDVSISLNVSAFQKSVLNELQKIPYGETRTYGEIAKILKTSPRAVGNACRNNPLPLIIPCHRVLAADGIGGYDGARSGRLLDIKRRLLSNEGVYL
ncbi:MAG: MGMT family protein [Proteobacteria bacterium]|nr:MGMT family protein [Pseudomonadota bacterium]